MGQTRPGPAPDRGGHHRRPASRADARLRRLPALEPEARAPCPTTCATPLKPLKAIYRDLARANPDVVKREVIGRSVLGQPIVAYKVTADAKHA